MRVFLCNDSSSPLSHALNEKLGDDEVDVGVYMSDDMHSEDFSFNRSYQTVSDADLNWMNNEQPHRFSERIQSMARKIGENADFEDVVIFADTRILDALAAALQGQEITASSSAAAGHHSIRLLEGDSGAMEDKGDQWSEAIAQTEGAKPLRAKRIRQTRDERTHQTASRETVAAHMLYSLKALKALFRDLGPVKTVLEAIERQNTNLKWSALSSVLERIPYDETDAGQDFTHGSTEISTHVPDSQHSSVRALRHLFSGRHRDEPKALHEFCQNLDRRIGELERAGNRVHEAAESVSAIAAAHKARQSVAPQDELAVLMALKATLHHPLLLNDQSLAHLARLNPMIGSAAASENMPDVLDMHQVMGHVPAFFATLVEVSKSQILSQQNIGARK